MGLLEIQIYIEKLSNWFRLPVMENDFIIWLEWNKI